MIITVPRYSVHTATFHRSRTSAKKNIQQGRDEIHFLCAYKPEVLYSYIGAVASLRENNMIPQLYPPSTVLSLIVFSKIHTH